LQVQAQGEDVGVQAARDHGQALGARPGIQQLPQSLGDVAGLGVGPGRLDQRDVRGRLLAFRLDDRCAGHRQALAKARAERASRLRPLLSAGIRRALEQYLRAAQAHQRFE
jgi:hypothetical protein